MNHLKEICKCSKLGFQVIKKRTAPIQNNPFYIRKHVIGCEQSQVYRDRTPGRSTTTDTSKPTTKEKLCDVKFSVFERHNGRLFVRKNGGCCWEHNHPSFDPDLCREGIRNIPEPILEKAKALLLKNVTAKMVGEFVVLETGITLSDDSLNSLKHQVQMSKFGSTGSKMST